MRPRAIEKLRLFLPEQRLALAAKRGIEPPGPVEHRPPHRHVGADWNAATLFVYERLLPIIEDRDRSPEIAVRFRQPRRRRRAPDRADRTTGVVETGIGQQRRDSLDQPCLRYHDIVVRKRHQSGGDGGEPEVERVRFPLAQFTEISEADRERLCQARDHPFGIVGGVVVDDKHVPAAGNCVHRREAFEGRPQQLAAVERANQDRRTQGYWRFGRSHGVG